jgi:hypothetical protein
MARPISVKLERHEERRALAELALREYRAPADQAAYLIVDGLRRAGVLAAFPAESQTTEARL